MAIQDFLDSMRIQNDLKRLDFNMVSFSKVAFPCDLYSGNKDIHKRVSLRDLIPIIDHTNNFTIFDYESRLISDSSNQEKLIRETYPVHPTRRLTECKECLNSKTVISKIDDTMIRTIHEIPPFLECLKIDKEVYDKILLCFNYFGDQFSLFSIYKDTDASSQLSSESSSSNGKGLATCFYLGYHTIQKLT